MRGNRRGQVTAEVAVLFTFVVAAFVFMGVYLQRGAQGGIKGNVDSLGQQFSTGSEWNSVSQNKSIQAANEVTSAQCSEYEHSLDSASTVGADGTDLKTAPECVSASPDTTGGEAWGDGPGGTIGAPVAG